MRIINVIVSKNNQILSVDSFGVFEEQLVDEVVKPAEKLFEEKCREYGYDEDDDIDLESLIEEGYYGGGNFNISLVWSDITYY